MLIKLVDINKIYGKGNSAVKALKNINLTIDEGEFIAITGTSGAGKSSLLHILGCIDIASSGKYTFMDKNIVEYKEKELAKIRNNKIGFVLQDFGLIEHKTVEQNVMIPLLICGKTFSKAIMKDKVHKALKDVGIIDLNNRKVNELSGGQRQRVAIARALINNPDLILADEPTGNLDSENSKKILELLSKINQTGKTIVIITHDLEMASYCKRKIYLKDGFIKEDKK